jgi:hypothetical protein
MAKSPINKKQVQEVNEELGYLEDQLLSIADRLSTTIKGAIEDIKEEGKGVNEILANQVNKNVKDLAKGLNNTLKNTEELYKGTLKVSDVQKQMAARETKRLAIIRNLNTLEKAGTINEIQKAKAIAEINEAEEAHTSLLEDQLNVAKKITKNMGVMGALVKGISKIPILGDLIKSEEILAKVQKKAAEEGSNRFKVMGAGFKALGSSLLSSLSDPLVMIPLLVKGFTSLLALGQKFAQYTADIGKAFLGMGADSKTVAKNLKAMAADDLYMNFEEAKNAMIGLNKVAGTNVQVSKSQIKNYKELTHFLGLSEEAAQGLFKTSLLSGSSFEDVASEIGGVVAGLNQSNGLSLNLNDILEDVSKASATTRFNMGQNPKALAKAAFEARRLGMNLDQIASSAESTLDFESSIANEIKAELLLGKDLNLERLRLAALTGDTATQAKELNRLLAENVEATEGNVIKQKALADSLGMSVEDMLKANQARILQNELSKKGITDRVKAEKALDILMSKGLTREQALQKISKENLQTTIDEGKKAESSMRMLENAKETLMVSIAPLADKIAKLVQSFAESDQLKSTLKFLGKTLKFVADNAGIFAGIAGIAMGAKMLSGGLGKLGTKMNPMVVTFAGKALGGLKNIFSGGKASTKVTSAVMKGTGKKVYGAAAQAAVKAGSATAVGKSIGKVGAKLGAKTVGKSILKKIPGIGLLAGIGFGINRAMKGDFVGAALELASGGASLLPGIGTGASVAIDAGLAARDISKATSGGTAADFISRPGQPIQKFRADDVVVGGTNIGSSSGNVEQLLQKILVAVESGGNIYMDGNKVGQSLNVAERSLQ